MLELRPNCEHCRKELPPDCAEAMICSFECTYCRDCALELFENVCPSCGGNFQPRPIRPQAALERYPSSEKEVYAPKSQEQVDKMKKLYGGVPPIER